MKSALFAVTGGGLLALAGMAGCGDEGGGSGGSGVDGNKLASEVTDADAKKVCEWVESQGEHVASRKQLCTVFAVSVASTASQCNTLVDACLESPESGQPAEEEGDTCADVNADEVRACDTIKVSEYEACVRAYIAALEREISAISCADAGKELDLGDVALPAACDKIERECPDLIDTIADQGSLEVEN